jgi:hypothetical protein
MKVKTSYAPAQTLKIEVEGSCKSFYKPIQSLIFNFILVLDQKQSAGHSGMELASKNVKN